MCTAILIDAKSHEVRSLALPGSASAADLALALESDDVALGARLPDGTKIYLDPLAIYTSKDYFHHCFAGTPLPGRGVIVGDRPISTHRVRLAVDFMSRDEAFRWMQRMRRPQPRRYESWLQEVAEGKPGISVAYPGFFWRCQH